MWRESDSLHVQKYCAYTERGVMVGMNENARQSLMTGITILESHASQNPVFQIDYCMPVLIAIVFDQIGI